MDQTLSPPAAIGVLLRHDMKPDRIGWTVYDALEGRPICLGGTPLVGLSFEDADELVRILNRQDLEIEREARRLVLEAIRPRHVADQRATAASSGSQAPPRNVVPGRKETWARAA